MLGGYIDLYCIESLFSLYVGLYFKLKPKLTEGLTFLKGNKRVGTCRFKSKYLVIYDVN